MNVLIDISIGSATIAGIVGLVEVMLALQARRRRAAAAPRAEPLPPRQAAAASDSPRPVAGGTRAAE